MAQKYVVKKDDNLLKVAQRTGVSPAAIKTANGIKTLTPGQTIRVPNNFSDERGWDGTPVKTLSARERDLQAGAANQGNGQNGPFNVTQNPIFGAQSNLAQGSFVSGSGQVNTNVPAPIQTGGMLSGDKNAVFGTANIHTQAPIYGQVNITQLQQQIAQQNNGSSGGGYNQYGNLQYTAAARPQVPFEQDPAAWRAYWNYSAQHPETVESVVTQYRPTIRELKDKQRRSEGGSEWEQEASYSSFRPIDPNFYGNNVNTALSWRVG